jgi:hypothetical protein
MYWIAGTVAVVLIALRIVAAGYDFENVNGRKY